MRIKTKICDVCRREINDSNYAIGDIVIKYIKVDISRFSATGGIKHKAKKIDLCRICSDTILAVIKELQKGGNDGTKN